MPAASSNVRYWGHNGLADIFESGSYPLDAYGEMSQQFTISLIFQLPFVVKFFREEVEGRR
jgi:hypothetical protein